MNSVKIKELYAPEGDLAHFDPGAYLSELEFYETDHPITETDRIGLANFIHVMAFLALDNESDQWTDSVVRKNSSAYQAIEAHFSHLEGWERLQDDKGLEYRLLVSVLMPFYEPSGGEK